MTEEEIVPTPESEMMPYDEPWYQIFIKALTQPNLATYEEIAMSPDASIGKAYAWLAASGLVGGIVSAVIRMIVGFVFGSVGGSETLAYGIGMGFGAFCIGIPLGIIISLVGFTIYTGISHGIAKMLGGQGDFAQLAYTIAAYTVPISLISSFIISIPIVNMISLVIGIYAVALNIIAIKAVHQFDWGRAAASSVLVIGLALCIVAFCLVLMLTLMGPAIGDVFSNIIQDLQ
ncbi:MAG: YIP1 family protein [Anaerolineae bacterium]|nr:YIP1 family protein [Anaerolineae bacterium]